MNTELQKSAESLNNTSRKTCRNSFEREEIRNEMIREPEEIATFASLSSHDFWRNYVAQISLPHLKVFFLSKSL